MFNGFRCSLMLKFDLANNFTKTSQKGNKITKLGADKPIKSTGRDGFISENHMTFCIKNSMGGWPFQNQCEFLKGLIKFLNLC